MRFNRAGAAIVEVAIIVGLLTLGSVGSFVLLEDGVNKIGDKIEKSMTLVPFDDYEPSIPMGAPVSGTNFINITDLSEVAGFKMSDFRAPNVYYEDGDLMTPGYENYYQWEADGYCFTLYANNSPNPKYSGSPFAVHRVPRGTASADPGDTFYFQSPEKAYAAMISGQLSHPSSSYLP